MRCAVHGGAARDGAVHGGELHDAVRPGLRGLRRDCEQRMRRQHQHRSYTLRDVSDGVYGREQCDGGVYGRALRDHVRGGLRGLRRIGDDGMRGRPRGHGELRDVRGDVQRGDAGVFAQCRELYMHDGMRGGAGAVFGIVRRSDDGSQQLWCLRGGVCARAQRGTDVRGEYVRDGVHDGLCRLRWGCKQRMRGRHPNRQPSLR